MKKKQSVRPAGLAHWPAGSTSSPLFCRNSTRAPGQSHQAGRPLLSSLLCLLCLLFSLNSPSSHFNLFYSFFYPT